MRARAKAPPPHHDRALERLTLFWWKQVVGMRVAVEDAHHAFTVSHELPDPALVECRLVALVGMAPGEEAGELTRTLHVSRLERMREQPVEVEPVEATRHLLHELEELDGVGR